MCARGKLKRRRLAGLLLGACILITTALLGNALTVATEMEGLFDRAYQEMDGPQLCCLWGRQAVTAEEIREYLDSWPGVVYQITDSTKTVDYIEREGVKLSNGILLELPQGTGGHRLSPKSLDGRALGLPGPGEVWVTAKMARILHLDVGDSLMLQFADKAAAVQVGAVVTDPVFGGSSTNIYRMWCGPGQLEGFPLAENSGAGYLELRFPAYSPQAEQDFIRGAEEYFQMPLGDALYTYDRIKSGYTWPYQIMGALLGLVSVVLAGAVVALTMFLIQSDMEEDARNIGIYKSLGLSGGQVMGIYAACYGAIGLAGAGLGGLAGSWLSRGILTRVLRDIGLYTASFVGVGRLNLLAAPLVLAAVLGVCLGSAFKVRGLNASYAVRTGAWQAKGPGLKEARSVPGLGGRFFAVGYAVRGIWQKKLRYGYIAGMSLVLGCLTAVCLGGLQAVQDIDQEPEVWGFIRTDIYVTSQSARPVSGLIGELREDPRVDYTYGANKVAAQYKPEGGGAWQSIPVEIYQLPWGEAIKDHALYGRRPQKEGEAGIGLALAKAYGLEPGGRMELVIGGQKQEFAVTGVFQTLSNFGNVIRIGVEDLDGFMEAEGGFGDHMLVLKSGVDKWAYAQELSDRYGGDFSFIPSKSNGENISGVLAPAVGTVLTVLLGVTVLITASLTSLLVRRERRVVGLLKAIGMTPRQVLCIYAGRNCLAALAGGSLGALLGVWVVPGLLAPYARMLGLAGFPFAISLAGLAFSLVLLPGCMFLGTFGVMKPINRAPVKELVSE